MRTNWQGLASDHISKQKTRIPYPFWVCAYPIWVNSSWRAICLGGYALPPLTREDRATKAKVEISTHFNTKQQVFLDFVLSHYVIVGVEELDQSKLTPLLRLKYHDSIADAVAELGRPDDIAMVFAGFQKYLYTQQVAA